MKMKLARKKMPLLAGLLLCLVLLATWGMTNVFADTPAWPHLTSLALNSDPAKAVLTPNNDDPPVPITAVEYENYKTIVPEPMGDLDINYVVGEITLHIAEPLGMTTYELKSDALNAAFSELTGDYTSHGLNINSAGYKTAEQWAGSVRSNLFAYFDDGETEYLNYYYELKVVVDPPAWPHLTSLALNSDPAKAVLTPKNDDPPVPITAVEYENYETIVPEPMGDYNINYVVGEITLHIAEPLGMTTYELKSDALNAAFSELTGYYTSDDLSINSAGYKTAEQWAGSVRSNLFAYFDDWVTDYLNYYYELKVVVDPPAWPHLTSLALNSDSAMAVLTPKNDDPPVPITAVEYENYETIVPEPMGDYNINYVVGEITLHIAEPLGMTTYELKSDALNAAFSELTGYYTSDDLSINSAGYKTAEQWAGSVRSNLFAYFDDWVTDYLNYYYELKVVVDPPAANHPPELKAGVTTPATASVTAGTAYTLDLSTIFEDADGDLLTYQVQVNGAAAVAADESYSYTPAAAGTTTLVFTANDGTVDSTDTYTVNLTATALPEGPAWPHLTSLALNSDLAKAVLTKQDGGTVPITAVEYENVDELIDGGLDVNGDQIYIAGEVILKIGQELESNVQYQLKNDALIAGFSALPASDETQVWDHYLGAYITTPFTLWTGTVLSTSYADTFYPATWESDWYHYNIKVEVDSTPPAWPHLTSLALNSDPAKAVLTPKNDDPSVPITAVEYENYETIVPEPMGDYNINYVVGEITLHIAEPLGMTTYELKSDALNAAFSELTGYYTSDDLSINSAGYKTAEQWAGSVRSNLFAYFDDWVTDYLNYYYELKVVVDPPAANHPPELKAGVTTPATASVTAGMAYTLDLSTIFEDADGDLLTYQVQVNGAAAVAADESYSYTPAAAGTTTLVFTANDGTADSTDTYTVNLTATAQPEGPAWPHLTSLALNSDLTKAVLTKQGGGTVPITAVEYENVDELVDGGLDVIGDQIYIAGEVTLKIGQELEGNVQYQLKNDALVAGFSVLPASDETQVWDHYLGAYITTPFTLWTGTVLSTSYADTYYLVTGESDWYHYNIKVEVDSTYVDTTPPALTAGPATRTGGAAATVKFTSDEAGAYYYEVADAGAAAPTVATTGAGTPMVVGENTITLSGLSDGAKKIYIMAKDNASTPNVTAVALVIDIPAYTAQARELLFTNFGSYYEIRSVTANSVPVVLNITNAGYSNARATANIEEGSSVVVTIMPKQVGDIAAVTFIWGGQSLTPEDYAVTDAFSFTFTMPEADTKISSITFKDPVSPRYAINTAVSNYLEGYSTPMGTISVAVEGTAFNQAEPGAAVVATAAPLENKKFAFRFVRWEAEGLTLTDTENPELVFNMPENAVMLTAIFEKFGSSVTLSTNNYAGGELALNIVGGGVGATSSAATGPVTDIYKSGAVVYPVLLPMSYNFAYRISGFEVKNTTTGQDVTITETIEQDYGMYDPGATYLAPKITLDGESSYSIKVIFEAKAFANLTAAVNDTARGTATVAIGDLDQTSINGVIEGQTVTVKAVPTTGYLFKQWHAAYDDESDIGTDVTFASPASATTTFTMPATSRDITVTAEFERDPVYASSECEITDVALYVASDMVQAMPLGTVDQSGTAFTITLPYSMDTSNLGQMILKIDHSLGAAVTKDGDGEAKKWAAGQPCGMELGTPATFIVLAEDGEHSATYTVTIVKSACSDKDITAVQLCEFGGTPVIADGVISGTAVTITLPENTSQGVLNNIGMKYLKITHSAGSTVAQSGGYDDAGGDVYQWAAGDVMCNMDLNTPSDFIVTAEDGTTKSYTITIAYTAPGVTLSNGSAERTSDTAATVTFTSSEAGSYYYAVVNSGAAAPTVSTSGSGTTANTGANTINLTNLTAGARDIYIVVKNASGVESAALKVAIPAYSAPGGQYTVSTSYNSSQGTITVSPTTANAGDIITVTVMPKSGYQMTAGSLKYTPNEAGAAGTAISGSSFAMPDCNVTVSCTFETGSGGTVTTDGITAFSINGVAGVINQATLTISIVMPYGTDVTTLAPAISTHNVAGLSPVSGEVRDFSRSVTYTATLADGTAKSYVVTVYVQEPSKAQQMWENLINFYDQVPWWEYAQKQVIKDRYPRYW